MKVLTHGRHRGGFDIAWSMCLSTVLTVSLTLTTSSVQADTPVVDAVLYSNSDSRFYNRSHISSLASCHTYFSAVTPVTVKPTQMIALTFGRLVQQDKIGHLRAFMDAAVTGHEEIVMLDLKIERW